MKLEKIQAQLLKVRFKDLLLGEDAVSSIRLFPTWDGHVYVHFIPELLYKLPEHLLAVQLPEEPEDEDSALARIVTAAENSLLMVPLHPTDEYRVGGTVRKYLQGAEPVYFNVQLLKNFENPELYPLTENNMAVIVEHHQGVSRPVVVGVIAPYKVEEA